MEQALPKGESLVNSMASSRLPTLTTERTGPKISSRATRISPSTLSRMVGPMKKPSSRGGSRPSSTTFAPSRHQPAAAGAALAGVAVGAGDDVGHRFVEDGVGHHDHGVLGAGEGLHP